MSSIKTFKDLTTWQEAHKLVLQIYILTKNFPREEIYSLTSQMRRCAISVTSNIAEGFSRTSLREKAQFYSMAQGSLTELQSQLLVARDVGYIELHIHSKIEDQSVTVHKLLTGLLKKVRLPLLPAT